MKGTTLHAITFHSEPDMRTLLSLLTALSLTLPQAAWAAAGDAIKGLGYRTKKYHVSYELHPDSKNVITTSVVTQVLDEKLLESMKTFTITYSTSAEEVSVIEALTIKADGTKREVPKSNYQLEVNSSQEEGVPPAFSDETVLTIVFPELEVNDSVSVVFKKVQKEQFFPGHFAMAQSFSVSRPYESVIVDVDAPQAMPLKTSIHKLKEEFRKEENGRQKMRWTFTNPTPVETDFGPHSVYTWGDEPSFIMSSFPSYKDIATSYGERATKKAAVTERIKLLADQLVKGETKQEEVVRALYEWVSKNITYAGNCIGIGAVVPRDLDFVLDNKMGDCKDHATLLQALLNAKGIPNTQALIGAGPIYTLPSPPLVTAVNHVISYIPSLDLFLDATAQDHPFGSIPSVLEGKPVLLVDGFQDGLKAKSKKAEVRKQLVDGKLEYLPDGSIKGTTDVTLFGQAAHFASIGFEKMTPEKKEEFAKQLERSLGEGSSSQMKYDYKENSRDQFKIGYSYTMPNVIKIGSAMGLEISLPFSPSAISAEVRHKGDKPIRTYDFKCSGFETEERYSITFPEKTKILAIPDPVNVKNEYIEYSSSYALEGRTVTAIRKMVDRTPGPTCKPSVDELYREAGEVIRGDIEAQIVVK